MKLGCNCGFISPLARAARNRTVVPVLCVFMSLNALALSSSLQQEEVQEAYSLGQSSNRAEIADFLHQYRHDFKYPSDNPNAYVQSVEFQTPFEQIVLRSLRKVQYTKFQADEDYRANPGLVLVRAAVSLRTSYAGPLPPDDSFQVIVSQAKPIEPRKTSSKVICNPYNWNDNPIAASCVAYTREILLQFDAEQFAPGKAAVSVALPFGEWMETKYNLDKLK